MLTTYPRVFFIWNHKLPLYSPSHFCVLVRGSLESLVTILDAGWKVKKRGESGGGALGDGDFSPPACRPVLEDYAHIIRLLASAGVPVLLDGGQHKPRPDISLIEVLLIIEKLL